MGIDLGRRASLAVGVKTSGKAEGRAAKIGRAYGWFLVAAMIGGVFLFGFYGVIYAPVFLVVIVAVRLAVALMRADRLTGAVILAAMLFGIGAFFIFADVRYTQTHYNLGGWAEGIGSALDNNYWSHLAGLIGASHVGIGVLALVKR